MSPAVREELRRWRLPLVLIVATFASMMWTGALYELQRVPAGLGDVWAGWVFAVPMLAILLAHELGHYVAAKWHRVEATPPYFIPVPFFFLGTMGAVIAMKGRIRRRDALLDIGAAGPLAGLLVAIPVLWIGLAQSPVQPPPTDTAYLVEGRSLLYLALIALAHGPLPPGHDVFLSGTALAGWGGLLVTMINLIPIGQLDGGHVAYALLGPRQDRLSTRLHAALPWVGLAVGVAHAWPLVRAGASLGAAAPALGAGVHWVVWAAILLLLRRASGARHPPTDDHALSPGRRAVAYLTLALFALLFMPSWIRPG